MITITNNNIYYTSFGVINSNTLENAKIIKTSDIIKYLSDTVEFGESLTFKRLFDIASQNVSLFNNIFYKSLGGYNLYPYLQEIENNITDSYSFDYIELSWQFEKYDDDVEIYPSLNGVSYSNSYTIDSLIFTEFSDEENYRLKNNNSAY